MAEKAEDRLNLNDEFSVEIKKKPKATDVNAPKLLDLKNHKALEVEVITDVLEPNPELLQHEPETKKVFAYDPETKLLIGDTIAYECAIEKGTFHVPANATETEPNQDFEFQKWDGKKWIEFIPPVVTPPTPEEIKIDVAAGARMKRNELLSASDFTQMSDYPGDKAEWAKYRQALRDLTEQTAFPEMIVWPEKPSK